MAKRDVINRLASEYLSAAVPGRVEIRYDRSKLCQLCGRRLYSEREKWKRICKQCEETLRRAGG